MNKLVDYTTLTACGECCVECEKRKDGICQGIPLVANMVIRKLNIEELPLLPQLFDYNDVGDMMIENTENLEKGVLDIYCAFHDGRLLGELHVSYEDADKTVAEKDKRAYLFAFRVHKDYQGQGIGTRLLETVINKLVEDGYCEFTVGVEDDNVKARHMYEKQGFHTVIARKEENYQGDSYEYDLLFRKI